MRTTIKNNIFSRCLPVLFVLAAGICGTGCEDFLDVESPVGEIPVSQVFEDETTAAAALTTLYAGLRDETLLTGNFGLSMLLGYYTDEFDYYYYSGQPLEAFYNHQIIPSNNLITSVWNGAYSLIFMCNSLIEGVENSPSLSVSVKNQITGEALFIRALTHFYLANLYGDVPFITSTDYLENQNVSRLNIQEVYHSILTDLQEAKQLLPDEYVSQERIRANRFVVSALLARVYLYTEQWQNAETESSLLIHHTSLYNLESDISNEFLKESTSAILQLKPSREGDNTYEAGFFVFQYGPPFYLALNPLFVDTFEEMDLRRQHWIKEVTNGSDIWYAPYKYKQTENTGTSREYAVSFRLAEQILIRAEARARTGNLEGSRQDLNLIRGRAGLQNTSANNESELIDAVLKERKSELFAEHGHRWFDLKRLNKADEVLSAVKPNWKPTDILFPVPESELLMNPNLSPQNPGY